MSSDYRRPRDAAERVGERVMSGTAFSQNGVMSQLQDNVQFRLNSLRNMLTGAGGSQSMSPLERRQELRNRRQNLLSQTGSGFLGGKDAGASRSGGTSGRTSGNISNGKTSSSSSSQSVKDGTPSMSDVKVGTRQRAIDQGYVE